MSREYIDTHRDGMKLSEILYGDVRRMTEGLHRYFSFCTRLKFLCSCINSADLQIVNSSFLRTQSYNFFMDMPFVF
jgi:hypothetical protein